MNSLNIQAISGVGLPLVLFHGWGFDSHVWVSLVAELQSSFDVYLVDLPGFGQSEPMEWDEFHQALFARLPPKFAVLGWSMGGGYAIRLASAFPERVSYLIGVSASPKFICDPHWPGIDVAVFDLFMKQFAVDPTKSLETFVKMQTGKAVHIDPNRLPRLPSLAAGLSLIKNWDLRSELERVPRACFMFGRLDAIVPVRTLTTMQERYPHFDYVLFEKDAHMPFISNPSRFVLELKKNLNIPG